MTVKKQKCLDFFIYALLMDSLIKCYSINKILYKHRQIYSCNIVLIESAVKHVGLLLKKNKICVYSWETYTSCLTLLKSSVMYQDNGTFENGSPNCLLHLGSREKAIKHILSWNVCVPKARLWDDNSRICLPNTVLLDGVFWHVAQPGPVHWSLSVWWRDKGFQLMRII